VSLGLSAFVLTSCISSSSDPMDVARAMPPPDFDSKTLSSEIDQEIMLSVQSMVAQDVLGGADDSSNVTLRLETSEVIKSCRIKDKFDTDALIAYQMEEGRLSLDVDGIGYDSQKVNKVYLNYTVSLQPELEKKDHCRYASNYQGILGSVYSEIVVHQGQNLSEEVEHLKAEVGQVVAAFVE